MAQKFTNVEFYIIIIAIIGILSVGIVKLGTDAVTNSNTNLDNDSLYYISNLNGINLDEYNLSRKELESSTLTSENSSQGNTKDDSLEFLFAKKKGLDIEYIIKRVFTFPSFIIVDLLRFKADDWRWILDIIGWFLAISITLAIIYYVRLGR